MANNFHDINGLLIFGLERHAGFHIFPPAPMVFLKLNLLHPFTMGGNQKDTVKLNGVNSVVHEHEPSFLWPHLGIMPDPLDALTPLQIAIGGQKCWLPRGSVEICNETSTCCVIAGPLSINADCWDVGKWPCSMVLNPGTVQTTPTVGDFLAGAMTLAVDAVIDLVIGKVMKFGGKLLGKLGKGALGLAKKAGKAIGKGLKAAGKAVGKGLKAAGKAAGKGLKAAGKAIGKAAKAAGEKIGKAAKAAGNKLKGIGGKGKSPASNCKNSKCTSGLEPVDLASGRVIETRTDFALPGAIPFVWERNYSSSRALERTGFGRGGWGHAHEQWIDIDDETIVFRDEEGRDVYFPLIAPGESTFHRADRLTLKAFADGSFTIYNHETRLTRIFRPLEPDGPAHLRAIHDAFSNAITFEYSGDRLCRIIDTAGRDIRVKSTAGGRIVRVEVWASEHLEQWVDYSYAKMGELASVTDALGHTEIYEYDDDHRLIKKTLKNGTAVHYVYDDAGRCSKSWCDGGAHEGRLEYDVEKRTTKLLGTQEPRILHWNEDGLVVREETPDGIVLATYEYDEDQYLLAETNGAGETTRYEYDERGNRVRLVDAAGNVAEWAYHDDLPLLRSDPDGLVTKYQHDEHGSLVEVTYPSELQYRLKYDERGHLREVYDGEDALAMFVVDAQHQVVEELDARGGKTEYAYDSLGRPISRKDALGRITEIGYDRLGQPIGMTRPDGTTTKTKYDPLGNPLQVIDALGQETWMEYGGTGVLTKLVQPDGREWRFKYTPNEKLRSIENPRNERYEFVYDTAGRVVEEHTFDERKLVYRYSKAGRLERIDYPDGSYRAFAHDPVGNVLREESTDGPIDFRRDRMGRLLGAALRQDGREIVTLFERDKLGRVLSEVQDGRRLRYEYDIKGRRTSRVMPDGQTTQYRYDKLGELIGLSHEGHETTFERDVLGREMARRAGSGKVAIRSEYDSMDRIIEQRVEARMPGGGVPQAVVQRLWQYDPLGRVKLVEDGRWGATTYRYDAVGQLLEARRGAHGEAFAYDAAGSIQKMLNGLEASPEQATEAEPWEIGKGNLLMKTDRATYAYDRRGRRLWKEEAGKRTGYQWDARDRLREVALPSGERLAFTYDAFGRRLRKEVQDEYGDRRYSVDFIWDGDVLAGDFDSRYGARCFVHAPGSFVPLLQAERGEVFNYVVDQVGVPKELIDADGRVAWSAAHSAWGKITDEYALARQAGGRKVESPFRLLGQYADEETGLCYTRFRYFDAEVGRWCSADPLGIEGGGDLFGFGGSPSLDIDPLGLTPATSVNARDALNAKLSALQGAQESAAKIRELPDGRIRYYEAERAAKNPGMTRGASYVTEWDPKTGKVRSWNENYGHDGKVVRVHPKMVDGQQLNAPHYPPTAKELAASSGKKLNC